MLVGRESERAEIESLLERTRTGYGASLVLRGEPGIGKTTLIEHAVERADGFSVLRALGVESEAELPFASLHELVRPVVELIAELPEPQAAALEVALALRAGAANRLSVYAGTLTLIAAAATTQPVLCVVDDAQWLDQASAEALSFAARRLEHDRVAMLFAAREAELAMFSAPGVPELRLAGLRPEEAGALLAVRAPGLPADASARLVQITHGNPLAMLEFAPSLAKDEELDEPLPVGQAVERAFKGRWSRLSDPARQAALLLAVTDGNEPEALWRALESEGIPSDCIAEAEGSGLLVRGRGMVFTHPLARSAIYHAALPAERRAAHRAVGSATTQSTQRAWHFAAAAEGPDEEVARTLEHAATEARMRAGVAAEAKALERAARLTPEDDARAVRLLKAGQAAEAAGRLTRAEALLAEAADLTADFAVRADAVARRSYLLFDRGEFDAALDLATAEAARVGGSMAGRILAGSGAVHALLHRLDVVGATDVAERAASFVGEDSQPDLDMSLMRAWTWELAGRTRDAGALVEDCLERVDVGTVVAIDFAHRLLTLEKYSAARTLLERIVAHERQVGATANLAYALEIWGRLETRAGSLTGAYAAALECAQLTEPLRNDVGLTASLSSLALVEAMLGRSEDASVHGRRSVTIAESRGDRWNEVRARSALGLEALARGDAAGTATWLRPAAEMLSAGGIRHPNYFRILGDLIEAEVRLRSFDEASEHLAGFVADADSTASRWARAVGWRCRGLLADEPDAEETFSTALELHDDDPSEFERARTELCYGERLRRVGQRRRAREQLRSALETFERLGSRPWVEHARAELSATGEHLRQRRAAHQHLTPQELQVALAAADGLTNKEIAARLFLSPKTIEFHLSHAYRKLDVRSRAELVKLFAERAVATSGRS